MNQALKSSLIHGAKVAAHIIFAMIVAALGYYLIVPAGYAQLSALLEKFGLSVGLINILTAVGVRYYQLYTTPGSNPADTGVLPVQATTPQQE